MTQTILERVEQPAGLRVDRQRGLIEGVRILGLRSVNGRRYLSEAVRRAVALYEGAVVNADHGTRPGEPVPVSRRAGWLQGVRQETDGGLRGNLHLLQAHPVSAAVMEAAERNPRLFGLSHNVRGSVRRVNGEDLVESIDEVVSVDLVADPATNQGLHEAAILSGAIPDDPAARRAWLHSGDEQPGRGARPMRATTTVTARELVRRLEASGRVRQARVLLEAIGSGAVGGDVTMDVGAGDAEADRAVRQAFRQAWIALFDAKIEDGQKLAKAKALLASLSENAPAAVNESRRGVAGRNIREGVLVPDAADSGTMRKWLNS